MTIGLAGAIKNAIRHCFKKVFKNDKAVSAAVTLPKFKLKWVELQMQKELYKQMLGISWDDNINAYYYVIGINNKCYVDNKQPCGKKFNNTMKSWLSKAQTAQSTRA